MRLSEAVGRKPPCFPHHSASERALLRVMLVPLPRVVHASKKRKGLTVPVAFHLPSTPHFESLPSVRLAEPHAVRAWA
jgi:hypothetical protein